MHVRCARIAEWLHQKHISGTNVSGVLIDSLGASRNYFTFFNVLLLSCNNASHAKLEKGTSKLFLHMMLYFVGSFMRRSEDCVWSLAMPTSRRT